jgi:hypothetical protein
MYLGATLLVETFQASGLDRKAWFLILFVVSFPFFLQFVLGKLQLKQ